MKPISAGAVAAPNCEKCSKPLHGLSYTLWACGNPYCAAFEHAVDANILGVFPVFDVKRENTPIATDPRNMSMGALVPPLLVQCGMYGCKNLKDSRSIFCDACAAEYREDPDAFK